MRALCALAALPRPHANGNHAWDSRLLSTKSKKTLGWVHIGGYERSKEDATMFVLNVDVARSNMDTAGWACNRYREDPERRTLITAFVRFAGDPKKGDYFVVAALGAGRANPPAAHGEVKGVDEIGASLAALKLAQTIAGEPFVTNVWSSDAWGEALKQLKPEP
jgi:hypothetical protein